MQRILLTVLGLLIVFTVAAQTDTSCSLTIKGYVMDKDDRRPLNYAAVSIKDLSKGAYTNDRGEFEIRGLCPGEYTLTCYHMDCGDTAIDLALRQDSTLYLLLPHNLYALDEVTISAEHPEERTTVPEVTIDGRWLEQERGRSLGEILSGLPGVNTLQTGPTIFKPVIHGLHSNRILIINNHVRLEGQQWGSEHAPEIDPFASDEIRVIKGAGMLRYGPDAIGGVIITEPGPVHPAHGIEGTLKLAAFSNNRQGAASAMLEGRPLKAPSISWRVQGTFSRAGNSKTPGYYLKNTGLQENDFSALMQYHRPDFGADLYYSQYNIVTGIFAASHIGNLTDLYRAFESPVPLETAGFTYDIDEPYQKVGHELTKLSAYLRTGHAGKLNLIAARQFNDRSEYDKHNSIPDQPSLDLELTTHSTDVFWEQNRTKDFKTLIGLSGIWQKNTFDGRFFIPNYLNRAYGAYIIENYRKNKWEFEGGLRYDHKTLRVFIRRDGELQTPVHVFHNPAGNLGLNYDLGKNNMLGLQAGTAWRSPTVNELYSNGLHHGAATIEIGDTGLLPERAYNVNLEFVHNSRGLSVNISPYVNFIHNYLYTAPQLPAVLTIRGAFPVMKYGNTDALFNGVDAEANYKFHPSGWGLGAKASYLLAYDLDIKDHLVLIPANRLGGKVGWDLRSSRLPFTANFGIEGNYVMQQNNVPANSDYVDPPPAYFLLDLSSLFIFQTKNGHELLAGLSINNLLDTAYRDYMDRFRYFADARGRNISLRLSIPFDLKKIDNHK